MSERPAGADDSLVSRARAGDTVAFMQLVERFDRSARVVAFRLLGRAGAVDDVLQDAYVRAYRGLRHFRGGSSFETWLYRIVYNACVDELRRCGRITELPLDRIGDRVASAASPEDVAVRRGDLAAALAALPIEQRAVVLLVDALGLDYESAGATLGIPIGTVGSRLNHARAALRATLEPPTEVKM